jgi:DNA-binding IscR family transcriptional regulator
MDWTRKCSDNHPCNAHPRFHEVQVAYHQFLRETTLSDLAENGKARTTLEKIAREN